MPGIGKAYFRRTAAGHSLLALMFTPLRGFQPDYLPLVIVEASFYECL